jgi:hypothetical protein
VKPIHTTPITGSRNDPPAEQAVAPATHVVEPAARAAVVAPAPPAARRVTIAPVAEPPTIVEPQPVTPQRVAAKPALAETAAKASAKPARVATAAGKVGKTQRHVTRRATHRAKKATPAVERPLIPLTLGVRAMLPPEDAIETRNRFVRPAALALVALFAASASLLGLVYRLRREHAEAYTPR